MAHHHAHHPSSGLYWGLGLTVVFSLVELVGGLLSNSLALIGDAGHMFTDALALGIASFAAWVMYHPPSPKHSYGLLRAEIVAAMVNGLFMLLIVGSVVFHAFDRISHPHEVNSVTVIIVAAIGLVINLIVAHLLHRGEQNINTRAALLHVIGDILGSVAALASGVVIYFSGWTLIDPLLSLLICGLILISSFYLLREVLHIIMEGVPTSINLPQVGRAMAAVKGVDSVHDLHIWTISSGVVSLSAHVVVRDMVLWPGILDQLKQILDTEFSINHVTIQPETSTVVLRPMNLNSH